MKNDNYLKNIERQDQMKEISQKTLEKSCVLRSECSLEVYVRHEDDIKEIFFKNIYNTKIENRSRQMRFLDNSSYHSEEIADELKKQFKVNKTRKGKQFCTSDEEFAVLCVGDEVIAVFTAENCSSCVDKFIKEFENLNKKHSENLLIQFSHAIRRSILNFFTGSKEENEESFIKKIKKSIISILS